MATSLDKSENKVHIDHLHPKRFQKTGVFSRISVDILDRFLQSFHHMKRFGCINDWSGPLFPICQGTLAWQPNNIGKSNECRLILPAFFALAFESELEYRYLYVHINSSNDQATSDMNLVGSWPVPPEFTRINCVQQASFSTQVCLSAFARWSTVMFRY